MIDSPKTFIIPLLFPYDFMMCLCYPEKGSCIPDDVVIPDLIGIKKAMTSMEPRPGFFSVIDLVK